MVAVKERSAANSIPSDSFVENQGYSSTCSKKSAEHEVIFAVPNDSKTSEMPDLLKTKWESRLTCRGNEETFQQSSASTSHVLRGGETVDETGMF